MVKSDGEQRGLLAGLQRRGRSASAETLQVTPARTQVLSRRLLGAFVTALGGAVVGGWLFGIDLLTRVLPRSAPMQVNAGVGFVLAGASLLLQRENRLLSARRLGRVFALAAAVLGALTLLEGTTSLDLGLDSLLLGFASGPQPYSATQRMAPNAAAGFVFAGVALTLFDIDRALARRAYELLTLGAGVIGFAALAGYSLGTSALSGVPGYASMSLNTACGLVLLAVGMLAAQPHCLVVAILAQDNSAGAAVRRMLPLTLGIFFLIAWLRLKGQQLGFYGTEFGLALTVTTTTAAIVGLALWNARVQGAFDGERKRIAAQLRSAIEAAPTGMLMADSTGSVVLVNAQVEVLFGYSRMELLGASIELLVPTRFRSVHAAHRARYLEGFSSRIMAEGREIWGQRKDGTEIAIEIKLTPVAGDFVLCSIVDITARKQGSNERLMLLSQLKDLNSALEQRVQERTATLQATLREREALLQEVHHRVKNNLHVIVSLIEMQGRLLPPGGGKAALDECKGRVHAISLIHEKLYQAKNYADVPFANYLRGLASDVFHALGTSPSNVMLRVSIDDVVIPVEQAVACGLVVNELITNALKHGFPDGREGTLSVSLQRSQPGSLELSVVDDGIGLPAEVGFDNTSTLGLRLVSTLAQQLDARLSLIRAQGTCITLTLPERGVTNG